MPITPMQPPPDVGVARGMFVGGCCQCGRSAQWRSHSFDTGASPRHRGSIWRYFHRNAQWGGNEAFRRRRPSAFQGAAANERTASVAAKGGAVCRLRRRLRREDYLQLVAHELRAPAAAVDLLAGQLAAADGLSAAERVVLASLRSQARQLVDRAEDLLTLGQLEHGSLVLTRERIDLREVVDRVVRDFAEAQVELALPKAPLVVTGDARRLADALRNLVLNAVKYTPAAPWVRVAVRRAVGRAVLEVTDRGIGLSSGEAARLARETPIRPSSPGAASASISCGSSSRRTAGPWRRRALGAGAARRSASRSRPGLRRARAPLVVGRP